MLIRNIFLIILNGKSYNGLQIDSKFPAYLIGLLWKWIVTVKQ